MFIPRKLTLTLRRKNTQYVPGFEPIVHDTKRTSDEGFDFKMPLKGGWECAWILSSDAAG